MELFLKILKEVVLLPFLPIRLGWRWSEGAKMSTKGALFNKHDEFGNEIYVEKGGCLPRLMATAIVAGILYYGIAVGIRKILPMFGA